MQDQLTSPPGSKSIVTSGPKGLQLGTMEEYWRFAGAVAKSGFAPKGVERQESIFVALQMGAELGLTPMASLQSIAVINGRPGIYGDAALALVRASGLCDSYSQSIEGKDDARRAIVTTKRKGGQELTSEFSVADAKKASLWGKSGPWSQYPDRMLLFRARGFNLRDNFGDVLKGFRAVEEMADEAPDAARAVAAKPIFGPARNVAPPEPSERTLASLDAPMDAPVPSSSPEPEATTGAEPATDARTATEVVAEAHAPDETVADADLPAAVNSLLKSNEVDEKELLTWALAKGLAKKEHTRIYSLSTRKLRDIVDGWPQVQTEIFNARDAKEATSDAPDA